jgi:murein DD-endopeptidase / murein LD-carboxypeptidase
MAARVVARARSFVGTPFRLHGRDASGVDCVGLAALAWRRAEVPTGYALRTCDPAAIAGPLRGMRFRRRPKAKPGDILILNAGPAQLHLGIWTGDTLIHADAALRRVVETPGPPRWPVLSIWRP